jgi:hypothetical protein
VWLMNSPNIPHNPQCFLLYIPPLSPLEKGTRHLGLTPSFFFG